MRVQKLSTGRKVFLVCCYTGLILLAIACILPFLHLFSLSLSSSESANAGLVGLFPKDFTVRAYQYVLGKSGFMRAFWISILRVILGTAIGVSVTILAAYPLSKDRNILKGRAFYVTFFYITAFFYGGLVPTYMVLNELKLLDTIWALVLPNSCIFFNMILMVNFFRSIPKALEEAALIDGASQYQILWRIILPVSMPGIATLTLYIVVFHWNSWFEGLIFMNKPEHYPLQSYLSTLILPMNVNRLQAATGESAELLKHLAEKSIKAANIFLGALPIMLVFPFLQRYFIKGIMLGSVKE